MLWRTLITAQRASASLRLCLGPYMDFRQGNRMHIERLELENFRCFGPETTPVALVLRLWHLSGITAPAKQP